MNCSASRIYSCESRSSMLNSLLISSALKAFRKSTLPMSLLMVVLLASTSFAASYVSTTLKELTQRAATVAEVEVLNKSYPEPEPGSFQRTHVEMKLLRTLKGNVPDSFTLD